MSLGAKVSVAILLFLLMLGTLASFILLPSVHSRLEESLTSQLSTALDLLATISDLPVEGGSLPPGVAPDGFGLLTFDSNGSKVSSLTVPELSHTFGILSRNDVPPPSLFVDHASVGLVRDLPPGGARRTGVHSIGVLLPTGPSQKMYAQSRSIVIVFLSAVFLAFLGIGLATSTTLSRRVHVLRGMVSGGGMNESLVFDEPRTRDIFGRLEEEIIESINRERASKRELQRLQVVRSQFLANVSHEVRTPLFSLKGFLETLLEGGIDDPSVNRSFLEKALHHAERIDILLRDLIDISRIESGEMRMSFRYFMLSTLFDRLRTDFEETARTKSQTFRVEGDALGIGAIGDVERLRQAIANLVENGLKYSPEGSTVVVRGEKKSSRVVISVSDDGPGMEKEHQKRVFERFYRVDPDRSRDLGGTGLGLAIVKHIIEAHGSTIVLESEPGKGTTFSFELKA